MIIQKLQLYSMHIYASTNRARGKIWYYYITNNLKNLVPFSPRDLPIISRNVETFDEILATCYEFVSTQSI